MTFRHVTACPLRPNLRASLGALALCAAALSAGCESSPKPSTPASGGGGTRASGEPRDMPVNPQLDADLERRYVIGPAAARELNYRIDWQYDQVQRPLKHLIIDDDSVYALDDENYLTRINAAEGRRYWRVSAAAAVEEILDIDQIGGNIYLTTGGGLLVLDAATGGLLGRQKFDKFANTAAVEFNGYLIYGSRNGQVVWHSFPVAHQYRAYQVAHTIPLTPVLHEGYLVAVGNSGQIIVLSAAAGTQFWGTTLLDRIVAPPAVAHNSVFIAGLDQHLRAFDLGTGRNLWRVLTSSPLSDSPVVIGERLYQQIPGEGLTCFNAIPYDAFGGEKLWVSPQVRGNVVMERRDELLTWHEDARHLTIVEATRGGIVKSLDLPQVERLLAAGEDNTELFASSADGRIIRLVPRN